MRSSYVWLWLFLLFISSASAQNLNTSQESSDLSVIQQRWFLEFHNPMLENESALDELEQNREIERSNAIKIRRGLPLDDAITPDLENMPVSRSVYTAYTYQVKVKNNGQKTIQAVIWDYIFSEPDTKQPVGRLRFLSNVNINPGKIKDLVKQTVYAPTGTINAKQAGKKLRDQYAEQIIIQTIQYTDGSIWKPPVH